MMGPGREEGLVKLFGIVPGAVEAVETIRQALLEEVRKGSPPFCARVAPGLPDSRQSIT